MNKIVSLLLIVNAGVSSVAYSACTNCKRNRCMPDYYWRDFFGKIPDDAIQAGVDKHGNCIYIGQSFLDNKILPGTIYEGESKIYTSSYLGIHVTNTYGKILCGSHPDNFVWLRTTNTDLVNIRDYLIPGGMEAALTLYIGKVFHNNDEVVGKVFKDRENKDIWIHGGNQVVAYKEYDILTYKCTELEDANNLNMDIRQKI